MAVTRLTPATLPDSTRSGYSQISIASPGTLAFVSGQVAGGAEGQPVPDALEEQAKQVVAHLGSALAALQATTQDIVQMRIYATNLNDATMQVVMPIIMGFLAGAQPSITGIGVVALAASNLKIEIEMVVQVPE